MPHPPRQDVTHLLTTARTEDDVVLSGALIAPVAQGAETVCIWIHTRQLGFAEPEYIRIGEAVAAAGVPFLTGNTRGHGFGSWVRFRDHTQLAGSAWEVFTDCSSDIDAWVERALALGYSRVVLCGHGFGGAKAVHYQAERGRDEVAGIVLASSASSIRPKVSEADFDIAKRMRAEGRGRDLMPWGTDGDSLNSTVSADWYLGRERMYRELYGQGGLPPALARIRRPVWAWFGDAEGREDDDTERFLDQIAHTATAAPWVETRTLRDVNFFYTDAERMVADALLEAMGAIAGRGGG